MFNLEVGGTILEVLHRDRARIDAAIAEVTRMNGGAAMTAPRTATGELVGIGAKRGRKHRANSDLSVGAQIATGAARTAEAAGGGGGDRPLHWTKRPGGGKKMSSAQKKAWRAKKKRLAAGA